MKTMKTRPMPILFAALALALAACGSEGAADDRPTVVATTTIVADLVQNVVGDAAQVEVIMGPGVDPHDFQASARQVESITEADLVVGIGLGLEESLLDVLEAGSERVLLLGPEVDPIEFRGPGHTEREDEDEDHASDEDAEEHELDPHVWQDPSRMAVAVEVIGERLDGVIEGAMQNAESYAATLRDLDAEVVERTSQIPAERRKLVTTHEAFGYYADAYDFEIVGVIIPGGTTLAEPSASDLAELAHAIEESGMPAIFAEVSNPTTLARAVSDEVGRPIEIVDLISDALTEDVQTYVEMIRTNTDRITEALTD